MVSTFWWLFALVCNASFNTEHSCAQCLLRHAINRVIVAVCTPSFPLVPCAIGDASRKGFNSFLINTVLPLSLYSRLMHSLPALRSILPFRRYLFARVDVFSPLPPRCCLCTLRTAVIASVCSFAMTRNSRKTLSATPGATSRCSLRQSTRACPHRLQILSR